MELSARSLSLYSCSTSSTTYARKRHSDSSSSDMPSNKSGPYDTNFAEHLIDNGIHPAKSGFSRRRNSLSSSKFGEEDFEKFVQEEASAINEVQVEQRVVPTIEGEFRGNSCSMAGVSFRNLDPLTDGSLVAGNPDYFDGAYSGKLNKQVREQPRGKIVPSVQSGVPIAPNLFLAVKGPRGTVGVANIQALYHGSLGARGIFSLQSHGHAEPLFDNNATTLSSTYCGGSLRMNTIHPTEPTSPSGRPNYNMSALGSWSLIDSRDTFRRGVSSYRNGRDWAEEMRDKAIEQANNAQAELERHPVAEEEEEEEEEEEKQTTTVARGGKAASKRGGRGGLQRGSKRGANKRGAKR
ncbi:MAG: hypothetical protein M1829_004063 [Trizodia sp. TS-e1964]|nr:MAG: hypothetical protein M1829_004063 [Trizodia sp. TS-e1964]